MSAVYWVSQTIVVIAIMVSILLLSATIFCMVDRSAMDQAVSQLVSQPMQSSAWKQIVVNKMRNITYFTPSINPFKEGARTAQ